MREVARAVAVAAAGDNPIDDPRLDAAIAALGADGATDTTVRTELDALVCELDQRAWDIQDEIEQGRATEEEYLHAFDRARVAAAAFWALDSNPAVAALESAYEAHMVLPDEKIRPVIAEALGSS
jgi:hypothetical protein